MSLLTSLEQASARRTRAWLILLGGLTLLIVVTAVLLAVRSSGITTQVGNSSQGGQSVVVDTKPLPVAGGLSGGLAPGVGAGDSPLTVDNQMEALALEACSQFAAGATVVEFAAWFEAEVGAVGVEEEALFQAILLRALSQTCPEVIPHG